ncbi:MarR family winged helix-turn-helix transcriptional regulator [Ramlibacter sp. WS9]|uniref:MarR family winged helix-turn-helix transcriptional regulator n=1 Tax=Ramlibacter sp. WS9 TaxID=1882741 RepID=UPI0011443C2B|nr:MarR family transcriptional regulator [Ramlibacter sp. WS9]ROZ78934.1 MarR family transcriptional regulator [Ramlibacter sp. WS9]
MPAPDSPFKHGEADASPGFLLWKITALWQRRLAQLLGEFGITQTQYAIIASLRWFEQQHEPPTQAHLVEHAKIDKMTLSKAIRKLEDDGLLLREPSPDDSRAFSIRFTPKGRKLVQQAVVAIEHADDQFFSVLGERQLADYKALTKRLISGNE